MGVRHRMRVLAGVLLAGLGTAIGAAAQDSVTALPPEVLRYADAVYYNAHIVTVDAAFSTADAMAIREGKILAVGARDRILKMAGPNTTKVDLGGKTVLPGLYEVHPTIANTPGGHGPRGPIHLGSQVIRFTDIPTGLKMIKEKAYAQDWKQSDGWALVTIERTKAAYDITRDMLDTIVPDRPLYLTLDNTMGILNSKGLERLPPEVSDMGIFKDKDGKPNGHIRGWANGVLTYDILPWPEGELFEKLVADQKFIFDLYNQRGVTTFGGRVNGLVTTVFKTLKTRNDLSVRVRVVSEMGRLNPHGESFFKRIGNIMDVGDEWFKIVGTTVGSIDGVARYGGILTTHAKRGEVAGAGAFDKFGENKWTDVVQSGEWEEKTEFRNFILAARYGWNVNDIHVIGDRGVDIVLEAMEESNKFTPLKDKRFGMVHGMMRRGDQMKQLASYGSKLSFTPRYLFSKEGGSDVENLKTQYGADILHDIIPAGTALKNGIHPVLESNEYVGDVPSWFFMMEPFVTRKNPVTGVVYGRHEAIDRKDALKMTTIWAAEFYGDEKIAGSLEPGKVADFIVIDRDYLTIPEDDISEIQVLATLIGGKTVFDRIGLPVPAK